MKRLPGAMWAAAFVLFLLVFQLNPAVEIAIDTAISGGLDMPQISDVSETSIENTGSDLWSETSGETYDYMVYLCEVNILKLPQISRENYEFASHNLFNLYALLSVNALFAGHIEFG